MMTLVQSSPHRVRVENLERRWSELRVYPDPSLPSQSAEQVGRKSKQLFYVHA